MIWEHTFFTSFEKVWFDQKICTVANIIIDCMLVLVEGSIKEDGIKTQYHRVAHCMLFQIISA